MKKKWFIFLVVLLVLPALALATRIVINGIPFESFANLLVTGDFISDVARVEVTASSTLTTNQVRRSMVTNYGMASNGDTTLPAPSAGSSFNIVTEAASQAWSFKPPSGEAFVLDGTALDANDEIDIGQTVGNCGVMLRIRTGASTYQWYFYSVAGSHTDGGAS